MLLRSLGSHSLPSDGQRGSSSGGSSGEYCEGGSSSGGNGGNGHESHRASAHGSITPSPWDVISCIEVVEHLPSEDDAAFGMLSSFMLSSSSFAYIDLRKKIMLFFFHTLLHHFITITTYHHYPPPPFVSSFSSQYFITFSMIFLRKLLCFLPPIMKQIEQSEQLFWGVE